MINKSTQKLKSKNERRRHIKLLGTNIIYSPIPPSQKDEKKVR